jgi:hypothetical protein
MPPTVPLFTVTASVYNYKGTLLSIGRRSKKIRRCHRKHVIVWYCVLAIVGFFALNWIYQLIRKPGEIFAPISDAFSKSPESTWQSYGGLFEKYSTSLLPPEFLAALAQIESTGNPIPRTYWRWQWSWNPFEVYRPASSALGMFQITDGTFAQARKYCIRHHQVVSEGPWHDLGSCWFNGLYFRTLAAHSSEMTAAYLHRSVVNALAAHRTARVRVAQKLELASVIHLCGLKRGKTFVAQGFRVAPGERCGNHNLRRYLTQVELMRKRFARLRENNT